MVLTSNMPAIQGRAAILAMFETMPPISAFKATIVDIDGRGDLAYVRGTYAMTIGPPGAPAISDRGKYIEVWKKNAGGTWKASYDSWTSDLPMPGLMVPTGAPAPGASAEIKKLSDLAGRWQIDGTIKLDPKGPAGPVALSLDCQWFTSGAEMVCAYAGTSGGQPYQEVDVYSYDARTKTYSNYIVANPGGVALATVTMGPGTRVQQWDTAVAGKPARQRLSVTQVTPADGNWKIEMSVAGGPWVTGAEGKYMKAK